MRVLTVALLVCVAVAAVTAVRVREPKASTKPVPTMIETRTAFANFMMKYKKVYQANEFKTRFNNFMKMYAFVATFEDNSFTVAINEFADLSGAEFARLYKGYNPAASRAAVASTSRRMMDPVTVSLPTSVDWRLKNAVTPVKDQGQCGSCWSFSTTGSVESAWFLSGKPLVGLSEQNLMDCSTAQGNMGCDGGLMDQAFQYIIDNKGIDTEASYPYTAEDGPSCQYNPANRGATISSYVDVPSGNETALTAAIAMYGPVSVAIDASHPSFQAYSSGVYWSWFCSSTSLDHGVLAVGYGNTTNMIGEQEDYYIVKNSYVE